MAVGFLAPTTAYASDEWHNLNHWNCDPDYFNSRWVDSVVVHDGRDRGLAELDICWRGTLEVYVTGRVMDTVSDGRHAELRIRYQVADRGGWSGWHYATVVSSVGGTTGNWVSDRNAGYGANQATRYVQMAVCIYNVNTLIDCDDAGWQ